MTEAEFAAALLDPAHPLPAQMQHRFAVYRNNVVVSLTEALRAGFPVVETLVGPRFFAAMAVAFLRQHPPKGRLVMLYGDALPQFIADFPPVAAYPYLADVARLEQALRESYHAADSTPLPGEALTALSEQDLLTARVRLAPAVRLIRSPWPLHAIWRATVEGGSPPTASAQDVVILRPEYDPKPYLLPAGGGGLVQALLAGLPLGQALTAAGPALDLPAILTLLLSGGAITGVDP